jgi:hypothetical protein
VNENNEKHHSNSKGGIIIGQRWRMVILRIIAGLILLLISRLIITHTMFALAGLLDYFDRSHIVPGEGKDLGLGFEAIGIMAGGVVFGIPLALSLAIVSYWEIVKTLEGIYQYVYHCWTLGKIVSVWSYLSAVSLRERKTLSAAGFIISLVKKLISLVVSFGISIFFAIAMSLIFIGAYSYFDEMKGTFPALASWFFFLFWWFSLVVICPMIRYFYKKINKLAGGKNVKL